ncbi:unnamed protein product [Rotaria sp. Silwood2]|nr:unnamed protein product [Rotaria sp. Silwood2]CAF2778591.1 unnamed protein product [Rotaria sp. Silwood2]CAF3132943.1 unnamed protein product [Rotaria sp. Silwood2]CAF4095313.1 unnamed protein product [Rotaria sp. Silwood2]CAF4188850.1 unnamed protein product [Rotaria sp. Silwood2]
MIEQNLGYAIEAQNLETKTNIKGDTLIVNEVIATLSIISDTLFWKLLASSNETHATSLLPSVTIEQATNYISKELAVLPYRVSLFSSVGHRILTQKELTCSSYDIEAGQIIEIEVCQPAHRQVHIILPTGKTFELDIIVDISIRELKIIIHDQEGIDTECQAILRGDQELDNEEIIYNCLANLNGPLNVKIVLSGPLPLDTSSLAPHLDFDFTDLVDTGEKFFRGNYPYERPYGCKRVALNVAGNYGYDDRWLGMNGIGSEE